MGFIELLYAWTFASFTFRIVHINARPSRVAMVTFDVINTFKSLTKHERCVEPRLTHKLSTDECRENQIFCTDKDDGNNVFFPDIEIVLCDLSDKYSDRVFCSKPIEAEFAVYDIFKFKF